MKPHGQTDNTKPKILTPKQATALPRFACLSIGADAGKTSMNFEKSIDTAFVLFLHRVAFTSTSSAQSVLHHGLGFSEILTVPLKSGAVWSAHRPTTSKRLKPDPDSKPWLRMFRAQTGIIKKPHFEQAFIRTFFFPGKEDSYYPHGSKLGVCHEP